MNEWMNEGAELGDSAMSLCQCVRSARAHIYEDKSRLHLPYLFVGHCVDDADPKAESSTPCNCIRTENAPDFQFLD